MFLVYIRNGITGLYKGVTSPLIGAMLENSALFMTYGVIKQVLQVDSNPTLTNPNPMWKYYCAGGLSGISSAFVLTPVELIKCNMQVQNLNASGNFKAPNVKVYSSPIDVALKIVRSEGIQGLWRGNVSCLMREIPGNVVWFGIYEFTRSRIIQPTLGYKTLNEVPLPYTMIAGACAGIGYWGIPYPIDTIKSQIQTDTRFHGKSVLYVARTIYSTQGISGFYKGVGITCSRAAFSNAFLFYAYEVVYREISRIF